MVNVPCPVLQEIYTTKRVIRRDGSFTEAGHGGINEAHAEALYRTVLARKPTLVLEIGMAYGLSSLAIVTALRDAGGVGKLISIDPVQTSYFNGIGRLNVERAEYGDRHQLIEEPDYVALPKLLQSGQKVDIAYIDGKHTFDYAFLDFFYCDKLLKVGGVLAFNDCGFLALRRVLRFVRTHRHYKDLDVGLRRDYESRNLMVTSLRWISGWSREDRYFEKLDDFEPDGNFYARF